MSESGVVVILGRDVAQDLGGILDAAHRGDPIWIIAVGYPLSGSQSEAIAEGIDVARRRGLRFVAEFVSSPADAASFLARPEIAKARIELLLSRRDARRFNRARRRP
jgi:hypothetical protein